MVVSTALLQMGFELNPETLPLLLIVAGLGLSIAEAMAPGAHFAVLGVALVGAGIVGLVLGPVAGPLVLAMLVLVFGGLALAGYRRFQFYGDTDAGQTSNSDSLRGRTGRVTERVTPRSGTVKLDRGGFNPNYAARSLDGEIPVGAEVLVVDPGGGNVLTVESLDEIRDDIDAELERGRAEAEAAAARRDDERDESTDENAAETTGDELDDSVGDESRESTDDERDESTSDERDETTDDERDGTTEDESWETTGTGPGDESEADDGETERN